MQPVYFWLVYQLHSTALQCSRPCDVDDDSICDSDTEFDAALRSTNDVIGDVTAADGAGSCEEDTVISAERVISEIASMLDVRCLCVLVYM